MNPPDLSSNSAGSANGDSDPVETGLAAHLRRTLVAVAATVTEDDPALASPTPTAAEPETVSPLETAPLMEPVAGPTTSTKAGSRRTQTRARTRRKLRTRLAVAGVAAGIAVVGLVVARPPGDEEPQAFAAEKVEVAESAPRLMVTADGWTVERVDEFNLDRGEITWTRSGTASVTSTSFGTEARSREADDGATTDGSQAPASQELSIVWSNAAGEAAGIGYEEMLFEAEASGEKLPDLTIAGHQALVFETDPMPVHLALWQQDGFGIGVIGRGTDLAEFEEAVASITLVDVDTWLSALPDDAVLPADRVDTVDEMLADIPLPPGFDRASVDNGGTSQRYQLAAQVTKAVSCAWFDRWKDATASGDTAGASDAVDAMATSPDWTALTEIADEGGWSDAVWELADAMADGGTIDNGAGPVPAAGFAAAGVCD
jgi:hypothetical protein